MIEDRSVFDLVSAPSPEIIAYGSEGDQLIESFTTTKNSFGKVALIHSGALIPKWSWCSCSNFCDSFNGGIFDSIACIAFHYWKEY